MYTNSEKYIYTHVGGLCFLGGFPIPGDGRDREYNLRRFLHSKSDGFETSD